MLIDSGLHIAEGRGNENSGWHHVPYVQQYLQHCRYNGQGWEPYLGQTASLLGNMMNFKFIFYSFSKSCIFFKKFIGTLESIPVFQENL